MKAFSASLLASAGLLLALPVVAQQAPAPKVADYVVHEWGTFTSMAGTAGGVLEGLHHEEEHLPKFVHDLMKVDEVGTTERMKLPASYVTQKMETPVIYFYADKPMRAEVGVYFKKGLMTQFYPLPTTIWPRVKQAQKHLVDMRKVSGSRLTWDIDILPRTSEVKVPKVATDDPWHYARQTGANLVRTRDHGRTSKTTKPMRQEAEHYLFYRGLGRWQPDVSVETPGVGIAKFKNGMGGVIPFVAMLQLDDEGGSFVIGGKVAGHKTTTLNFARGRTFDDRKQVAKHLATHMLVALVKQGLYPDEARAMVATWSRQWFQSNGTRMIYILPRKTIDTVLPLTLNPRPKELVRVMVGRHEFITPASQATVEQALLQRSSDDATIRAQGDQTLRALDRFLEPHLRNVERNGSTAECRALASEHLRTGEQ